MLILYRYMTVAPRFTHESEEGVDQTPNVALIFKLSCKRQDYEGKVESQNGETEEIKIEVEKYPYAGRAGSMYRMYGMTETR